MQESSRKSYFVLGVLVLSVLAVSVSLGLITRLPSTYQYTYATTPRPTKTVPDINATLKKVCAEQDMPTGCWKTLWGMARVESNFKGMAVGDHGKSHGWFQIRLDIHPQVSLTCAEDLYCSAAWTLTRMRHYGYPIYKTYSIEKHNGGGEGAVEYAKAVNYYSTLVK